MADRVDRAGETGMSIVDERQGWIVQAVVLGPGNNPSERDG
jgi:hypothetical protein